MWALAVRVDVDVEWLALTHLLLAYDDVARRREPLLERLQSVQVERFAGHQAGHAGLASEQLILAPLVPEDPQFPHQEGFAFLDLVNDVDHTRLVGVARLREDRGVDAAEGVVLGDQTLTVGLFYAVEDRLPRVECQPFTELFGRDLLVADERDVPHPVADALADDERQVHVAETPSGPGDGGNPYLGEALRLVILLKLPLVLVEAVAVVLATDEAQ